MELPYNPSDKNSIIAYAKKLKGKTLSDVCDTDLIKNNLKKNAYCMIF